MANEITVTGSLTVNKPTVMSSAIARSIVNGQFNMAGNFYVEGTISVSTSGVVIPLGQVTAPHWAWFKNLDSVNFLTIRNGSGGADLLKLLAGELTPGGVPLLDTSTPYAVANTAACLLEYLIVSL